MRRILFIAFLLIVFAFPVVAGTQSGSTFGTLTDNSLVFKGYYQGPVENNPSTDSNITLEFKDYSNNVLNHASQQGTSGTVVTAVNNRHVGENTGTIFTWSMKGTTTNNVHLTFAFSTLQAEVNGKYFVPAYSIVMTQNATKKITERTNQSTQESVYSNDTFYSSEQKTITSITQRPANPSDSEVLTVYTGEYLGQVSGNDWGTTTSYYSTTTVSWYRSGTCTLNISNYEQERPGTYRYVCWVITELLIE